MCVCVCVCARVILCNVITHTDDTPPHSDYIPKRRDGLLSFWGEAWWRRTYTAYVLTSPTSMTGPLLGVEPSCLHLSWWLPAGPSLPAPHKSCPSSQVWLRHVSMGNLYRAPRPHTMNPSAWFLSLHVMKNSLGTESGLCVGICASLRSLSI